MSKGMSFSIVDWWARAFEKPDHMTLSITMCQEARDEITVVRVSILRPAL